MGNILILTENEDGQEVQAWVHASSLIGKKINAWRGEMSGYVVEDLESENCFIIEDDAGNKSAYDYSACGWEVEEEQETWFRSLLQTLKFW